MSTQFKLIISSALMLCSMAVSLLAASLAGDNKGWKERMMAEKIAFFTTELDLTPKEAEVFWPVYNQICNEKDATFKEIHKAFKELERCTEDNADDATINKALDNYLNALAKNDTIDKASVAKYTKVLPVDKVGKLFIAEEKFRRKQIHQLQSKQMPPQKP